MLAGACKQKPPSFLILLFVPKSGFLKRQAVTSAASGKPVCFCPAMFDPVAANKISFWQHLFPLTNTEHVFIPYSGEYKNQNNTISYLSISACKCSTP